MLIVWLYCSFINECKIKVPVWVFVYSVPLYLNTENIALFTAYEVTKERCGSAGRAGHD